MQALGLERGDKAVVHPIALDDDCVENDYYVFSLDS